MPSSPRLSRRGFVALSASGLVSACAPRGGLTFVQEAPTVGTTETILVASTRAFVEGQPVFTSDRVDTPIFSRFEVSVPPDREIGSVVFPTTGPPDPPDPQSAFVTVSAAILRDEPAFVAAINAQLLRTEPDERVASLFVHGYNTTFAEGLYRHAQILYDYGRHPAAVHFAWPSRASAQGYVHDRESALFSRGGLEETILAMARSNADRMNLIAHSMGAFLMMETLNLMARVGYDEVFAKTSLVLLISPDIDIDVFRMLAGPVVRRGLPVFVVVSTRDRALLISAVLRGDDDRVGSIASPDELGDIDVTVIDISDVDPAGGMGHFALARSQELIGLLRGMRDQGIDVLATSRQQGLIRSSVSIIEQGAEMLLQPLAR